MLNFSSNHSNTPCPSASSTWRAALWTGRGRRGIPRKRRTDASIVRADFLARSRVFSCQRIPVLRVVLRIDGGLVPVDIFGKAKIGLGIEFGPQPPAYPNRSTSNLLLANLWGMCHAESASDSFVGGLGFASSEAHLGCTGSACQGWRSFNAITETGCSTGYRSLRRSSGNLVCYW